MAEIGNEPTAGAGGNGNEPEKTFTQAEVNAIVEGRLSRERDKYADYESLKDKAGKYDEIQNEGKTDLQKANEKADLLQKKLDELTKADTVRQVREKVSKETKVPAELLTGEDEEACKAQAAAILQFAKPQGYPGTKRNNGNNGNSSAGTQNDESMRVFARQIFGGE